MKFELTINEGTLAGQTFELETGHLLIGRGKNCSIRFDPFTERMVSTQHAFIEAREDGYYLIDNNSTNGTYLNNEKIQQVKLHSGDSIRFGADGIKAQVFISATPHMESVETLASDVPPNPVHNPIQPSNYEPQNAFDQVQLNQFNQAMQNQTFDFKHSVSNIGLSNPAIHLQEDNTGKIIGFIISAITIFFLMIIVAGLMFLQLGILPALVATVVAFIPGILYLIPFGWLDRYDPEPVWLLVLAFAWGALVAVILSFIINSIFGVVATITTGSMVVGNLLTAVISAPLFEESTKGIGLIILLLFFRRYFDDILDGIVFGGVIALGFATVENVLYYGRGIVQGGVEGLALLFLLRGILSPFAHVTFTAMTGIGCGISRESHNLFVKIIMPIMGFAGAVVLHAIWNGMAVFMFGVLSASGLSSGCNIVGLAGKELGLCGFLIGYAILEIPLFLIFLGFSFYIMRRQSKILKDMLAIDVARGLIPQEHLDKVTSAFSSLTWSLAGLTQGKYMARRKYIRSIGKLGLSYWHIQRATAAQGHTGSFQQNPILRAEVERWQKDV